MAQTYSRSKKQHVYFPMGKFDGSKNPRFLRAPFDLVKINGTLYVEPVSILASTEAIAQLSNADTEVQRLGLSQWFLDIEPIVLGEHEMGDFSKDNWMSFQRFGYV